MIDPIKKTCEKITETPKAILLKIEEKNYWFPKSKISLSGNIVEIEKEFFEKSTAIEIKEELVEIFLNFEDYSDKVYKLIVPIKKDTYEAEKFIFIPKSKVKELKVESAIIPKWIWEKSLEDMLDKEVEYFNKTYDDDITTNDYEIIVDVVEL